MRRLLLLSAVLLAAVTACKPDGAGPAKADPLKLMGRSWLLQDIEGAGALAEPKALLVFAANGRFRGHTGCNAMMGQVRLSGDTISIPGPVGTTRMACADDGAADQERRYTETLTRAARWGIEAEKLLIYDANNKPILQFAATVEQPAQ